MIYNQSYPLEGDCFLELSTFWAGTRLLGDYEKQMSNFEMLCSLLELNTICESVCLYDKMYIPARPMSEMIDLDRTIDYFENAFSKELYRKNIVKFYDFVAIIDKLSSIDTLKKLEIDTPPLNLISATATWRLRVLSLLENKAEYIQSKGLLREDDSLYSCLEEVHDEFGVSICPGVFGNHIFSGHYDIKGQLYLQLSELFKAEIASLQKLNCPINLYIPPITTIILSRASSKDTFLSELLALRDEFAGFRMKYRQYQCEILNPKNKTLNELYMIRNDCFNDLEKTLCQLSGHSGTIWLFEMLKAELGFSDVAGDQAESFLKGSFNIASLVKIATKGVRIKSIKGRSQILFLLWRKLKEIQNYHKLYEHLFNFSIEKDSTQILSRYSDIVRTYFEGDKKAMGKKLAYPLNATLK